MTFSLQNSYVSLRDPDTAYLSPIPTLALPLCPRSGIVPTIAKQLILNRLPLPAEIIDIVKDYAFHNIIDKTRKTKKTKDRIISLINNTEWTTFKHQYIFSPDEWLFWIEEDPKSIQGQCTFCRKCGNYLFGNYYIGNQRDYNPNIICECLDNNQ